MASDDAYELLLDGEPTGLVEVPFLWILDDAPYFGRASLRNPELVFRIFRSEFDVAYEEGGLFTLLMHPHIIGHRSRVAELDKLIEYMKSKTRSLVRNSRADSKVRPRGSCIGKLASTRNRSHRDTVLPVRTCGARGALPDKPASSVRPRSSDRTAPPCGACEWLSPPRSLNLRFVVRPYDHDSRLVAYRAEGRQARY